MVILHQGGLGVAAGSTAIDQPIALEWNQLG